MRSVSPLYRIVTCGLLLVLGTSTTHAQFAAGATASWRTSADSLVRWVPVVRLGGELYPSYLIATATVEQWGGLARNLTIGPNAGDRLGVIGVRIVAQRDSTKVAVTVELPGLAEPSTVETLLERSGDTVLVRPQVLYDYDALLAIRQPHAVNARVKISVNGNAADEAVRVIRVRSVNDVPFHERLADATSGQALSWMFAAFVNENHPLIDEILREALATGQLSRGFVGYQGTPNEVQQQIWAIWNALQNRGIRYSSIATPSAMNVGVTSQHVRSFEEALASGQANCVDGTVLFASLLRKIGIDVQLVLVPGHMFLSYFLQPNQQQRQALETTVLGMTQLAGLPEDGSISAMFAQMLGGDTKLTYSAKLFDHARATGGERFNQSLQALTTQLPGYALLDIGSIRQLGIMPINK